MQGPGHYLCMGKHPHNLYQNTEMPINKFKGNTHWSKATHFPFLESRFLAETLAKEQVPG